MKGERAADDLGQVGRGRNDLRLDPKGDAGGLRHAVAEQGGQGLAGDEAELRGEVLDDHREDVRGHENPHEQVAVARAGRDVGRDVAGVDVGDGRDEGGAEERDELMALLGVRGGHGCSSLLTKNVRLTETLPVSRTAG